MNTNSAQPKRWKWYAWLLICAASTAAYVGVARLGLMLASLHDNVSPVWPATGLSIWLLIVCGRGMWPAITVGAFVANALTDVPLAVAAAIAAGNTLEAVLGAWLWQWGQRRWRSMPELRELTGVLSASLLGPVASATVGVTALLAAGAVPPAVAGKLWGTWWTGDALGALTVFPALLAGPAVGRLWRAATVREAGRAVVLLAAALGVSWLAFMTESGAVFLFVIFPVLLLAMTWFGPAGAKWTAVLIAGAGITAAYAGHGPFTTGNANQDLLNLQVFLAAVTITALVLPVFGTGPNSRWPVAVLLVGWTLSGWVFATAQQETLRNQQELLAERITAAETGIRARMATYEEALRGGVSLMTASESVSPAEWRLFASTLQLEKRFPGIDGIGVVFRVEKGDKEQFLQRVRAAGAPDFAIHAVSGVVAPPGDEHYVITYLEPDTLNRRAIGLDVASEENRRQAANQARDTGEPCMSGRIILEQDELRRPGFLLFMPFYRRGAATDTVEARREALEGWIDVPSIMENFLRSVLEEWEGVLQLHFFEAGGMDQAHLLYATDRGEPAVLPRFDRVTEIELAGRHFQLGWRRGPDYPRVATSPLVWVAAGFALATLLLAGLVTSLQTFRQRAEQLAADRTAELGQTQRVLEVANQLQRGVLDGTVFSVIATRPDGTIEIFNRGAESMLGYTRDEMVGRQTPVIFHAVDEVATRAKALSRELGLKIEPGFEVFAARPRRGEREALPWTYVRKDGSRLPVQLSTAALRDEKGVITGFLCIAQDLTERKRAEQAREYAHSLTRATFESTADGILVVNREGRIATYNQNFSKMWRLPDEVKASDDNTRLIDCILVQLGDPESFFKKAIQMQKNPEAESMDTLQLKDGRVVERYSRPQRMKNEVVGRVWSFRDITQQHQAEARLRASEQRLQRVLGQADCIVWEAQVKPTETDWDWQYVYQPSGLFERLCGERLPPQGYAVWDQFQIPERAEMGRRAKEALSSGLPGYTQEFHVIGKGQTIWLREIVSITRIKTGEFWLVGVMTDITERKRSEKELLDSEARLNFAQHTVHVGGWDLDLLKQTAHRTLEHDRIFGYSTLLPTWTYEMFLQHVLPEDRERVDRCFREATSRQTEWNFECRIRRVDGEVRWIWAVGQHQPDETGRIRRMQGIVQDITTRKAMELASRESEQRVRIFAEYAPAAVAMFDREMRYVVHSAKWLRDYGLEGQDIIGRSHYEVFPEIGENWKAIHRRCLAGATEINEADPFQRTDGHRQWLSWRVQPWHDDTGEIGGIVMFTEDITQRKQLEESLAKARDQALEASRLKSEFLATMSHEIRTPMNAVIGMTTLLVDTPLDPKQREMTKTVLGGAEHLLAIINDLLDFSRIEAGRMRIDPVEFDFNRVVEETVALLVPRAREKNIGLHCEIIPWSGVRLIGDSGRVRQILTNLIGNAVKFTDQGRVNISVWAVEETERRTRLRVTIKDTGIGIPPDVQGRLFQPFVQADGSNTRRFGGTGLGLAISRQLIELMDGKIDFRSEPGKGSTFWFELDLVHGTRDSSSATLPPNVPENGSERVDRRLRLLLVEDNPANQRVATLILNKLGHAVELAGNGRAGLEMLAVKDYDAVLMDCQMPELDGYEATRRIRLGKLAGINSRVPIIALTAYARAEDRARCLEAGMDDYISKPIHEAELYAVLTRCVPGSAPAGPAVKAQAVTGSEEPVFDSNALATVRSLRTDRGRTLLADMVELYLSDEAERLQRLELFVREQRAEELAQAAHSLGGNAASFGGAQVRQVALALEDAARAKNWDLVATRLGELQQACARLRTAITHPDFVQP